MCANCKTQLKYLYSQSFQVINLLNYLFLFTPNSLHYLSHAVKDEEFVMGGCGRKSGNKIYCVSRSKQTVCLHSLEVITNPIVGRSPEPGLCCPFMLHDAAVAGLICSWLKAGPGSVQGNVIDSAYEKRKTAGKLLGSSGYLSLRGRFGLLRNESCCSRLQTRKAR